MDQSAETALLCLRAVDPGTTPKAVYPLEGGSITVGRHPSNDIHIPVESVSRFHARIENQGGRLTVVDLSSSNGTYVDGERITSAVLEPHRRVAFGNVVFSCEPVRGEPKGTTAARLKTPVEIVGGDKRQSSFILEAEAGKRDTSSTGRFTALPAGRKELAKAYRRLSALYRLNDVLHSAPEEAQVLERFMNLLFDVVQADRGAILLRDDPEGELKIRAVRMRDPADQNKPMAISQTIIDRCMQERVAVLSQDAAADQRFKGSESILLHEIRSTIAVPLVSQNAILGILHLDTRESVRAFNDDDLNFVTSLADELALFLDHRRMAEENQRSKEMAAVGAVITDLAHSIKNILLLSEGSVKLVDRLIDEGDMERLRQTWGVTQKTFARISTMVKEMLDYSRAVEVRKSPCNLNQIVRETCESFKQDFESKGVTVRARLDRRIEDALLDDKGLERCLVNLLVNACEAIKHDKGEITVTTHLNPSQDRVLVVEDNGQGIPADMLDRLFFPQFSTKGGEGTGLGLAMVKKWVTAVGGTIRVHSTEGESTRFVITLPREQTTVAPAD